MGGPRQTSSILLLPNSAETTPFLGFSMGSERAACMGIYNYERDCAVSCHTCPELCHDTTLLRADLGHVWFDLGHA